MRADLRQRKPLDLAAAWHGAQPSPANLNKNQIAAHTDPFCAPLLDGTEETAAALRRVGARLSAGTSAWIAVWLWCVVSGVA